MKRISIIMDCYKLSGDVKNYLHVLINPDDTVEELYRKSKSLIIQEFFPQRGFGKLRLSQAKKAITEFKSLSNNEDKTIDLMIYYVETGVEFTNSYGDINEPFYNSMASMYSNVIKKIKTQNGLYIKYNERLKAIVTNTADIGWGFHDALSYLYEEFLSNFEEWER
jgi:hypothetical protein